MTTSIVLELDPKLPTSVRLRCALERAILKRCVKALLDGGHTISVDNGECFKRTSDLDTVMRNAFLTDECHLYVNRKGHERIGSISFVYGNDGFDVISDYSVVDEIEAAVHAALEGLS